MRAWQVSEHGRPRDVLQLVDIDEPTPGPGEFRVRVEHVAIGTPDVFMCEGTYRLTPKVPFVAGQEICGVIDAVGDGVELAPGTRVMGVTSFFTGRGGFAEAAILYPTTAFVVPEAMSSATAAAFRIGFSTAQAGLVRRRRAPGR